MTTELQEVFQFMAIRAGEKLDKNKSRKSFIRDDIYHFTEAYVNRSLFSSHSNNTAQPADFTNPNGVYDVDLFSATSISPIGRLVYSNLIDGSGYNPIESQIENLLISGFTYQFNSQTVTIPSLIKSVQLNTNLNPQAGYYLSSAAEKNTYIKNNANSYNLCILPDDLAEIYTPLENKLIITLKLLNDLLKKHSLDPKIKFDINTLLSDLPAKLGVPSIGGLVFNITSGSAGYTLDFAYSKRILFDSLYSLYIFKKRQSLSLEPVIDGLRACHLLERLAILDFFSQAVNNNAYPANSSKFVVLLSELYPLLASWKPDSTDSLKQLEVLGINLINPIQDLQEMIEATPIINPIFARGMYSLKPFNSIKPIGIGDLKVVKQEFMGYRKTEIAHIETVLAGETKTRVHRSLEKSEDSFSFSSSNDSESTKDSQSTSRFEWTSPALIDIS